MAPTPARGKGFCFWTYINFQLVEALARREETTGRLDARTFEQVLRGHLRTGLELRPREMADATAAASGAGAFEMTRRCLGSPARRRRRRGFEPFVRACSHVVPGAGARACRVKRVRALVYRPPRPLKSFRFQGRGRTNLAGPSISRCAWPSRRKGGKRTQRVSFRALLGRRTRPALPRKRAGRCGWADQPSRPESAVGKVQRRVDSIRPRGVREPRLAIDVGYGTCCPPRSRPSIAQSIPVGHSRVLRPT
ncbi:hypothetical protein M885DRAFT_159315 [Pelagophyceae sp. CCMP2097]|nr:hypothetical protein M885DRAFT_159315 [Pelagophyceae sp. CCMP2097]